MKFANRCLLSYDITHIVMKQRFHDENMEGFFLGEHISDAVIRRLPGYYRHLRELEKEGVTQISSTELGERMGQTPSLVRQDINCVGGFGRQGYGYDVKRLKNGIGEMLGLNHRHHMIILGSGSIGSAVARYPSFAKEGFETIGMFDIDPARIGSTVGGVCVESIEELEEFCSSHDVDIAVLAVPADAAIETAERVAACGVCAIWNFAPVDLKLQGRNIEIVNVHLSDTLQVLSYKMEHPQS